MNSMRYEIEQVVIWMIVLDENDIPKDTYMWSYHHEDIGTSYPMDPPQKGEFLIDCTGEYEVVMTGSSHTGNPERYIVVRPVSLNPLLRAAIDDCDYDKEMRARERDLERARTLRKKRKED